MQDVIDFNLLKEYDTTLKEVLEVWTKHKAYSLGDKVKYKGKYLKCTTAGTTGTTTLNFTGLGVGDTINDGTVVWEIVEPPSGGVDLPEWQANTAYTAGKYLVHEGTVYKVTTNFTSGTTFDDTNLSAYIAPVMTGATSSNDGKSGIVPTPTTNDINKVLYGDGTWAGIDSGRVYITHKTLFSGTFNDIVLNTPITLTDNINNYDKINIIGKTLVNPSDSYASIELLENTNIGFFVNFVFNGASITPNYVNIGSNFDTTVKFYVEGIKFIPSNNVYTSKNLLWSGTHLDIASTNTITLNDNITNYDVIVINAGGGYSSGYTFVDDNATSNTFGCSSYCNATDLKIELESFCLLSSPNVFTFLMNDFGTSWTSSNVCPIKIYGLKFTPNPNDYSTTERRIGTWIDGKPLYQVTLSGNMSSSTTTVVDISSYGIDTVVETDGKITGGSGVFFSLNYYYDTTNWIDIVCGYVTSISNKKIFINHGTSIAVTSSDTYWVTIKYTKV